MLVEQGRKPIPVNEYVHRCPECFKIVDDLERFCPNCGTKLNWRHADLVQMVKDND